MNIPKLNETPVKPVGENPLVEVPAVDTQPAVTTPQVETEESYIFKQESRHDASPSNWCITALEDDDEYYNVRNIVTNREVICTLEEFNEMLRG